MVVVYFSVIWAERHAWQTLESSFSMYYLVQKLETVMFERQHQYSSYLVHSKVINPRFVSYNVTMILHRLPHVYPHVYLMLRRTSRFFVGHCPLMSTLTSTWCHAHDSFSQAFPLCFCMLQVIKNWRLERPGNEATLDYGLDYGQKFGVMWSSMLTISLWESHCLGVYWNQHKHCLNVTCYLLLWPVGDI